LALAVLAEEWGFKLLTAEEMRHNRTVADAIDEMTGGRVTELTSSNPGEWNRRDSCKNGRMSEASCASLFQTFLMTRLFVVKYQSVVGMA
jgi:hypothetical protein